MEWFIIGRDMNVLCAPSTESPKSLSIFNDKQTIVITNNVALSTYDFSVTQNHEDAQYLQMGNYIVFRDKYGKTRMYTLMSFEGNDQIKTWHAEEAGLDLINETANSWVYKEPHPIAWYLENLVIDDSGWEIGINEISGLSRTLNFDGQSDSKLTRLGDVANQFDGAEIDFSIEMRGSTVISQKVNIYKKLGVDFTEQRFIDGVNLTSLQSSGSIEGLVTAMLGLGGDLQDADGNSEGAITFTNEFYDDGRYYSPVGQPYIFDRVGRQQWSRYQGFGYEGQGEFQGYMDGIFTYDTQDPRELLNRTLTELKSKNVPSETYEANLIDIQADIGDMVQIAHNNYNPPIYLSARVEQVENCYTQEGADTGILGDYKKLQSQIDPRVKDLIDALKNEMVFSYTWIRYAQDDKGNGMTSTPTVDTKYIAIIPNKPSGVPSDDPKDYEGKWQLIAGIDGKDGVAGEKGADGRTAYTHFAYANNVSGTLDFSVDDPTGRAYMGVLSDFTKEDSTNPDDYVWSLVKGERGEQGIQGLQGVDGKDGIAGEKGADGKTSYTHIAYANNANGGGFSQTPDNHAYIGMYVDFEQKDSTDPTKYAWSLIKGSDGLNGKDGIAGAKGEDGKTSYTHIAYADTATGGGFSQESTNKAHMGVYVDFVQADSDDPKKYAWSLIKGADGAKGVAGKAGADGKTPYFHTAWANSADGKSGFSTTDSVNKSYLGTYTDYTEADSTDPTKYAWSLIKGVDGKDGVAGKAGADGKTPYFHTAWADSKDGKINFSLTDSTNRGYLGNYTDFVQADSTDPAKYRWTELVGAMNLNGRNLAARKLMYGWSKTTIQGDSNAVLLNDPVGESTAGLQIARHPNFKPSTEYVMSFDFQILTGIIEHIGGHTGDFGATRYIKIDGVNKGNNWGAGVAFAPPVGKTFHFEVALTSMADYSGNTSTGFFIQSNRGGTAHPYSAEITNLRINEGNKDMGWQRPPEDVDDTIASTGTPNLVYNAGFIGDYKLGLDGWTFEGNTNGWYMTNATLYNGSHSLGINQTLNTTDTWWVANSKPINVSSGKHFSISMMAYHGTTVPKMVGFEIGCYKSTGGVFQKVGGMLHKSKSVGWEEYKLENVTLPAETAKIAFRFVINVPKGTGTHINEYLCQPQITATETNVPYKDNQGSGSEITQVNQGLIDTNNKIAAVPHVSAQAAQPSNPKKGDQWWVLDAQGKATGFKVWNGTAWADSKIQQSMLNVVSLNAVTITGSTINGSKFTNSFDFTGVDKIHFQGVTEIANGAMNIDWKIPENNQTGYTHTNASGFESLVKDSSGNIIKRARLGMGAMYLAGKSMTNTDVSGELTEQDAYRNSTQSIQYLNGWGDWGNGAGLITVSRNGRVVTLSGYPKHNGTPNFNNIAQLPAWAIPPRDVNLPAMSLNGSVVNPVAAKLVVNTAGVLSVTWQQQSGYLAIGASYFGKDL